MWKIVSSTDGQHIGEVVVPPSTKGNLIFNDGDVVFINTIKTVDNETIQLVGVNCVFTAIKV